MNTFTNLSFKISRFNNSRFKIQREKEKRYADRTCLYLGVTQPSSFFTVCSASYTSPLRSRFVKKREKTRKRKREREREGGREREKEKKREREKEKEKEKERGNWQSPLGDPDHEFLDHVPAKMATSSAAAMALTDESAGQAGR